MFKGKSGRQRIPEYKEEEEDSDDGDGTSWESTARGSRSSEAMQAFKQVEIELMPRGGLPRGGSAIETDNPLSAIGSPGGYNSNSGILDDDVSAETLFGSSEKREVKREASRENMMERGNWRQGESTNIEVSEGGHLATKISGGEGSELVVSAEELVGGEGGQYKYYRQVEIENRGGGDVRCLHIGIARSKGEGGAVLPARGKYAWRHCRNTWLLNAFDGSLCGNGKMYDEEAGIVSCLPVQLVTRSFASLFHRCLRSKRPSGHDARFRRVLD
jgi:hypothetical protein